MQAKRHVITIEEHYAACGLGEALSYLLMTSRITPRAFACISATGYPSGRYGSQRWHQGENGLAGPSLVARLEKILRG
jgi:transketolase